MRRTGYSSKVKEGSTTTFNTDGQAKPKSNGNTDYSQTTTATTSDNVDTYEVYTIQGHDKTYIAREKLLFPWSKPANVTVGDQVKFAIEGPSFTFWMTTRRSIKLLS